MRGLFYCNPLTFNTIEDLLTIFVLINNSMVISRFDL